MYAKKLLTSTSIAALATLFAVSAPAQATDILTPADAYSNTAAPHSWTGLWLGAVGGYQFSNSAWTKSKGEIDEDDGEPNWQKQSETDGLGAEGFFGEAQIGFDKQIGQRTVVGVFGGYNINDAEHTFEASSGVPLEVKETFSLQQEWGGVLGARLGLLKSQDTMFYLAGGWAFGELDKIQKDGENAFADQETDLSGWFGEVGMESRIRELGDNIYLTVAGRYTDYGSIDALNVSEIDGNGDTDYSRVQVDHDTLTVMVGLKAKLGGIGF